MTTAPPATNAACISRSFPSRPQTFFWNVSVGGTAAEPQGNIGPSRLWMSIGEKNRYAANSSSSVASSRHARAPRLSTNTVRVGGRLSDMAGSLSVAATRRAARDPVRTPC